MTKKTIKNERKAEVIENARKAIKRNAFNKGETPKKESFTQATAKALKVAGFADKTITNATESGNITALYEKGLAKLAEKITQAEAKQAETPTAKNAEKIKQYEKAFDDITNASGKITESNCYTLAKRFAIACMKTNLQTAVKVEFDENGNTKKEVTGGQFPFLYGLYTGMLHDVNMTENEKEKAVFSDGMDLIHIAYAFLYSHIGENLNDTTEAINRKTGEKKTIKTACFNVVNNYINGEKQREYKRIYVDEETENGRFYYEIDSFFPVENVRDYKAINDILKALKLSANEKKVLKYRIDGRTHTQIAFILDIAEDNVKTYLKRIRAKIKTAFNVDEKTAEKALKARETENAKRKEANEKQNAVLGQVKEKPYKCKTYAEKCAFLERLARIAKAHGKQKAIERIRAEYERITAKESEKRLTEKKRKAIEKRLLKLANETNLNAVAKEYQEAVKAKEKAEAEKREAIQREAEAKREARKQAEAKAI